MKSGRLGGSTFLTASLVAVFTFAACGGSPASPETVDTSPPPAPEAKAAPTDTPEPAPTDTPESAPTDTPEPAPTDAPEPAPTDTPPPPPTDTPEPTSAPGYEAALTMAGSWVGEWNNLTYGSSGATTAEIEVSDDGTASITFDLDGNVFGLFDPDPITFDINFDVDGVSYAKEGDSVFGDLTLTVSDGTWSITAIAEAAGIALATEGTLSPESIEATYTVGAPDGSWSADGTFELHRP